MMSSQCNNMAVSRRSSAVMSRHTSQWHCRERLTCGGLACVLEGGRVQGSTTSGTTARPSPSLTGTETSQVPSSRGWDNTHTHTHTTKHSLSLSPPDNGDGTCVAMTTGPIGGFWDDKPCSEKHAFVCEKARPDITPPTKAPTVPPAQGCATGWTSLPQFRDCYRVNEEAE